MGKVIKLLNEPLKVIIRNKKWERKPKLKRTVTPHKTNKGADFITRYLQNLSGDFDVIRKCPTKKRSTKRKVAKRKLSEPKLVETVSEVEAEEEFAPINKKPKLITLEKPVEDKLKPSPGTTERTKPFHKRIVYKYINLHLDSEDAAQDLFQLDELKDSHENSKYTDWLFHICDEIALEGLDGITIEALWTRLTNLLETPKYVLSKKELLWRLICYMSKIKLFVLPESRNKLIVIDRSTFIDGKSGVFIEEAGAIQDIYPFKMVNSTNDRGSCLTYEVRVDQSENIRKLTLEEALNLYGSRLVLVADQSLRNKTILNELADPNVELTPTEYGMLERVGRARTYGELTQGINSIQLMIKDSKSIFHVRKSLEKYLLLKKQFFYLRSYVSSLNKTGKLLHLPRFFYKFKTKNVIILEQMVNLLRRQPSHRMEFEEFKKRFGGTKGIKKVIKLAEFSRYIRTDIVASYREVYPNATIQEWKCKAKDKEKVLKIFQLIDPTLNVQASWETPSEQNSDDSDEDDDVSGTKVINSDMMKEIFMVIYTQGKDGVSVQELERLCDLDFYTVRTVVRKLQLRNVIDCLRRDVGRQRNLMYFARCLQDKNNPKSLTPKSHKLPSSSLEKFKQIQRDSILYSGENIHTSSFSLIDTVSKPTESIIKIDFVPFKCLSFMRIELARSFIEQNFGFELIRRRTHTLKIFYLNLETEMCSIPGKIRSVGHVFRSNGNFVINSASFDPVMKLVLVKRLIFEPTSNCLEMLNSVEEDVDIEQCVDDFPPGGTGFNVFKIRNTKDLLLGLEPILVSEETSEGDITSRIFQSTNPDSFYYEYRAYKTHDKNITATSLSRINIILDALNREKVVGDSCKFLKLIDEIEQKNSKQKHTKMDKKSLARILIKLVEEGYAKIFKLVMTAEYNTKFQRFICHPTVDVNHETIKAGVDQMRMTFLIGTERIISKEDHDSIVERENIFVSPFTSRDVLASVTELNRMCNADKLKYKYNRNFGKTLGYQPKFVRMQIFHELLFYLIYEYRYDDRLSRADVEEVFQYYDTSEYRDIPPIYSKEVGWKMFVPPLRSHQNWPFGWALLCDILICMPFSLFVKFINISWEVEGLQEYLQHPIKKHYLVKDLPAVFRNVILYKRKYLSCVMEIVNRLCYIGLLQLGPQRFCEREQLFIYLNRNTKLLDTTTSAPSYHKVSRKDYKEHVFRFWSMNDIEEYWCQLWTISMNTPLGQRNVMDGKSVTIENANTKPALVATTKAKTPDEALLDDVGDIPGDKQGAAGFDSSMWGHIKRNWLWAAKSLKPIKTRVYPTTTNIRKEKIGKIVPSPIKFTELMKSKEKYYLCDENRKSGVRVKKQKPPLVLKKKSKKSKVVIRTIKARSKATPKVYFDAKDLVIRKHIGKTRKIEWHSKVDEVLRLCKAASTLLSNSKKQFIPYVVIRDVLHALVPETAKTITSSACKRRIIQLVNADPLLKDIEQSAGNLINLYAISKYFSPIVYDINHPTSKHTFTDIDIYTSFVYLISYMVKHVDEIETILQGYEVTLDYFSPKVISNFSSLLVSSDQTRQTYVEPESEADVKKEVIKSVIHSSLGCIQFNVTWGYQLYKIYEKFSDDTLRKAVNNLKETQLISYKKSTTISKRKDISPAPFQLSNMYVYMQSVTYSSLTFHTVYQNFLELLGRIPNFIEISSTTSSYRYGRLVAYNEVATVTRDTSFYFDVPDKAFVLNPYIEDHSELTRELSLRYHEILKQRYALNEDQEVTNSARQQSLEDVPGPKLLQIGLETAAYKQFNLNRYKNQVSRLILSIPCLCVSYINEKFSQFMETQNEAEINEYLKSFTANLTVVLTNLLNTSDSGMKELNTYIKDYKRTHVSREVDSLNLNLVNRIRKVIYTISKFLKSHALTDIKTCFDVTLSEDLKDDSGYKKLIEDWLDESYTSAENKTVHTEESVEKYSSFFKYNKVKTQVPVVAKTGELENRVPSVDELMRGIMKVSLPDAVREIPYISDLASLLSKEFSQLVTDEDKLEELKSHFIAQYPILEKYVIDDLEQFKKCPNVRDATDEDRKYKHRENLLSYCVRSAKKNQPEYIKKLEEQNCLQYDIALAERIIDYVYSTNVPGASGAELKENFEASATNLSLVKIVEILTESLVFLRAGVNHIVFVHYEFHSSWLVETFSLSQYERQMFQNSKKEDLAKLKASIEGRVEATGRLEVLIMPWIRVDGTLNVGLFEKWLTMVLSHCLDYPNVTVPGIFKKFSYLKPVDLFYLLETLQDMNCLKICLQEKENYDLFSDFTCPECKSATVLDSFEEMYIEIHNFSMINMGFYLNRCDVELL